MEAGPRARGRSDMRCSGFVARRKNAGGQWGAAVFSGRGRDGRMGDTRDGKAMAKQGSRARKTQAEYKRSTRSRPSHSTRACRCRMEARASTTDYEWPVRDAP